MAKKLSKEEWEQRIRDAGAGRYDFVRWDIEGEFGSSSRVKIRCVIDGFEWVSIVNSLVSANSGCPKCGGVRRFASSERIWQINNIKNISFSRWIGEYKSSESKALVCCDDCGGEWISTVNNIVNHARGCPYCAGCRRWSEVDREAQINSIYGISFVSWVSEYKNSSSKALVKCDYGSHEWEASVNSLINLSSRCPSCAKHGFNKGMTGNLYALRSECGRYVKVGISNDPKRRHKELERRTPFKFNLVERVSGYGAKIAELEKYFHNKYERAGLSGFDGATEWLICTDELLNELRTIKV